MPSPIKMKGMAELLPDQKFVQKVMKFGILLQISNELDILRDYHSNLHERILLYTK